MDEKRLADCKAFAQAVKAAGIGAQQMAAGLQKLARAMADIDSEQIARLQMRRIFYAYGPFCIFAPSWWRWRRVAVMARRRKGGK